MDGQDLPVRSVVNGVATVEMAGGDLRDHPLIDLLSGGAEPLPLEDHELQRWAAGIVVQRHYGGQQ
jgi:hypothetical protein